MRRRIGDQGFGSIRLLILALSFFVASIFIFGFGLILGQEMALRNVADANRVARGTIAPPMQTPPATAGIDPRFYKDMQEKAYAKLDQAASTPASPTPSPEATATPTQKEIVSTPTPRSTSTPIRPTVVPTRRVAAPPPPMPDASRSGPGGKYTVLVGTTKNAQDAVDLTLELRQQGFHTYTAESLVDGEKWYQVRAGRQVSAAEAREIEQRLHRNPRFRGARVLSQ